MREAEMKVYLGILMLGEHEKGKNQLTELTDETEILGTLPTYAKLKDSHNGNKTSDPLAASVHLDEPCATIWDTPRGRDSYISMTRSIIHEDSSRIEYLECTDTDSSKKIWWYPQKENKQLIESI